MHNIAAAAIKRRCWLRTWRVTKPRLRWTRYRALSLETMPRKRGDERTRLRVVEASGSSDRGGIMEHFDVIVVGAGSSGGVIAARLTEDEHCRVLLLEAGPDFPNEEAVPPLFTVSGEHSWKTAGIPEFDWDLRQHRPLGHAWRTVDPAAARPADGRHVDGQRHDRGARRALRFRPLGGDGQCRLVMGRSPAAVPQDRDRPRLRRPADPRQRRAAGHPALPAGELGAGQPHDVRGLRRARRARGAGPQRSRRPCRRRRRDAAQPLQGSAARDARHLYPRRRGSGRT